ncbi:ABC transporter permease [Paracoccus tibetensis]|uniref:Osmoprotectant transport system permease protein n=1 Tax=Paracoccus tibetensis TaxID=336292 RepID=A0A1G5EW59_9RHOB|nr:ABC transporter permease [Paracoccus tibetensis]SCY30658.1 osmoprotectant transport system permease protein [Paracoccus tibetensis]
MRLDRPGLLFALIGLAGLILPFAEFKPNRILAGEGATLAAALPLGVALLFALAAMFAMGVFRLPAILRLTAALAALLAVLLAIGAAARHLTPEGDTLARVSPASGFWLLLLALVLMLADAVARLRPGLMLRGLLLAGAVAAAWFLLASGALDQVSTLREYSVRREVFLREARAHLLLAFGSLGLALLVGLPIGMLLYGARRLRGPVLSVLNILQTIPSLALFGIMIPIFSWIAATVPGAAQAGVSGIGVFPALVALFLYSLLPVVSNTLTGLDGVSPSTRDAAMGLGLTRPQLLGWVLIPLALPVLLAAVRIVLVQNIGLAVIAGLIGGGGFGTFVFQGLNQTAMDLVLLGALPTIALTLVAGIAMDLVVEGTARRRQEA